MRMGDSPTACDTCREALHGDRRLMAHLHPLERARRRCASWRQELALLARQRGGRRRGRPKRSAAAAPSGTRISAPPATRSAQRRTTSTCVSASAITCPHIRITPMLAAKVCRVHGGPSQSAKTLTPRWLPFSSAMTRRARKACAFFSAMDAGACSCVNLATVVTKVLRSMSMLSRLVTLTAATSPARHRFTVVPAQSKLRVELQSTHPRCCDNDVITTAR
jgi:hypothetical protein